MYELRLLAVNRARIVRDDGRILAARRSQSCNRGAGKWEFTGGKMEFGETAHQGAYNETLQEVGVTIWFPFPGIAHVTSRLITDGPYAGMTHETRTAPAMLRSGRARPDRNECSEIRWVTSDEFLRLDLTDQAREAELALKHIRM